jgi:hypothetical protein
VLANLKGEFHLKYGTIVVPHLNRHAMSFVWISSVPPHLIPGHIGQTSRGLFLHHLNGPEFQPLFIDG